MRHTFPQVNFYPLATLLVCEVRKPGYSGTLVGQRALAAGPGWRGRARCLSWRCGWSSLQRPILGLKWQCVLRSWLWSLGSWVWLLQLHFLGQFGFGLNLGRRTEYFRTPDLYRGIFAIASEKLADQGLLIARLAAYRQNLQSHSRRRHGLTEHLLRPIDRKSLFIFRFLFLLIISFDTIRHQINNSRFLLKPCGKK